MRLRVLVMAQLFLALLPPQAQDSAVVPEVEESQQIPGPQCHFVRDRSLRLRATSVVTHDKSARRSAQDDDFVGFRRKTS
jgi:hypothetical protein